MKKSSSAPRGNYICDDTSCSFPKCINGTACSIKVACVGDSITMGIGSANRLTDSYPIQLGQLLGDKYAVCNYGCGGTTMGANGDYPYVDNENYGYNSAIKSLPDIIILMLGTNDLLGSTTVNQAYFESQTTFLVSQFLNISSKPTIYICSCIPIYHNEWKYDFILSATVIPAILNVVDQQKKLGNKVNFIDVNGVFPRPSHNGILPAFMNDVVHPNKSGYKMIADKVHQSLIA